MEKGVYRGALRKLYKLNIAVTKLEAVMMVLLMTVIMIAILDQVVCRYWLYIATPWAEELARYAFIWLAYIGGAYALFYWEHIEIDLIDSIIKLKNKHPEKVNNALNIVVRIICMVFLVYFVNLYAEYLALISRRTQFSASMHINMLIPMSSGIVGFSLMLFHIISLLIIPKSMRSEERK